MQLNNNIENFYTNYHTTSVCHTTSDCSSRLLFKDVLNIYNIQTLYTKNYWYNQT